MTRAQRRLWLSRAQRRMQFGSIVENKPSRFLADLPKECVVQRGRPAPGGGRRLVDLPAGDQPEMEMSGKPLDLTRILSRARTGPAPPVGAALAPPAPPGTPRARYAARKAKAEADPACPYTVGQRVQHAKFGAGMVVQLTAAEDTTLITVAFPGQGVKKLDARYAKLEKA
jgi:DNA helicase-2/ATP-dependent DNA helicase PcrA